MSFCPSKDIHSIYLDNELPEIYREEYESHVKSCPACQNELNKIKALRSALHLDSDSISLSDDFLDKSYERLQIKMAYSKNSEKSKKSNKLHLGYIATAAAAAAVFALIIPIRLNTSATSTSNPITGSGFGTTSVATVSAISGSSSTIAANNVAINSGRNVLVSGNMQGTVNHPGTGVKENSALMKYTKEIEVLRPDLEDEQISIRISVPRVGEIPVVTEVNVPMGIMSGKF